MLTWFAAWFWKPSVGEKPDVKPKPVILAQGRHSLSPYRILDWYSQHVDHQLDSLPPIPRTLPPEKPSPEHSKD
jgi:hypothetical protein